MSRPNLAVVDSNTGPPARRARQGVIPEPLEWTDESSWRAARRKWESLVRGDQGMRLGDRLILIELASYASAHAFAWPSAETIATKLGCSRKTAQRAIKAGRERGWISQRGKTGYGGSMRYCLSVDPEIVGEIERRDEGLKLIRQYRLRGRIFGES